METTTNPGLTAYIKAYERLKGLLEMAVKALDYDGKVELPRNVHLQLKVLRQDLAREMANTEKVLDEYVDAALNGDTLDKILDQLGPDDIDGYVHRLDIVDVARYAREHDLGDWDITAWTDDLWPEKDQELRDAVAQHMMQEKGVL